MCGEILASLSCTTVELLILVYSSCVAICRRSLRTRTAAGCAYRSMLSVQLAARTAYFCTNRGFGPCSS